MRGLLWVPILALICALGFVNEVNAQRRGGGCNVSSSSSDVNLQSSISNQAVSQQLQLLELQRLNSLTRSAAPVSSGLSTSASITKSAAPRAVYAAPVYAAPVYVPKRVITLSDNALAAAEKVAVQEQQATAKAEKELKAEATQSETLYMLANTVPVCTTGTCNKQRVTVRERLASATPRRKDKTESVVIQRRNGSTKTRSTATSSG